MFEGKNLSLLIALVLVPLAAGADEFEDLDVTMEVLDSEAELGVLMSQMRGPGRSDVDRQLGEEEEAAASSPSPFEENLLPTDDGFDHDNIFRNEPLTEEDDFESLEGEDLNLDLPPPDYVPPD
jgi:hypothetical protein